MFLEIPNLRLKFWIENFNSSMAFCERNYVLNCYFIGWNRSFSEEGSLVIRASAY